VLSLILFTYKVLSLSWVDGREGKLARMGLCSASKSGVDGREGKLARMGLCSASKSGVDSRKGRLAGMDRERKKE